MADDGREPQQVVVEQHIAADPMRLYELVSDVTNMGRWSPETTGCTWIGDAVGPTVGARFKGANKDGWRRWRTTSEVTVADPGKCFEFAVTFLRVPIATRRYDFIADGDGTLVRETWTDARPRALDRPSRVIMGVPDRAGHNREGMEHTLKALSAVV